MHFLSCLVFLIKFALLSTNQKELMQRIRKIEAIGDDASSKKNSKCIWRLLLLGTMTYYFLRCFTVFTAQDDK